MITATAQDTEKSVIQPYADLMRGWLARRFGTEKHAAKTLATFASLPGQDMDTSPRTTEGWKSGRSIPHGDDLLNLLAECDDLVELLVAEVARRKELKNIT